VNLPGNIGCYTCPDSCLGPDASGYVCNVPTNLPGTGYGCTAPSAAAVGPASCLVAKN